MKLNEFLDQFYKEIEEKLPSKEYSKVIEITADIIFKHGDVMIEALKKHIVEKGNKC